MKLKTSCYDPAIARMNLRRFAPIWILYTILLLVITAFTFVDPYNVVFAVRDFTLLTSMFNCSLAVIVCQLLFGDLYIPRLCYALHSLPVTRGGWFGSQIILSILGSLIPNLLAAGVILFLLPAFHITALWWLAASELQFLFFLGAAVLSSVCAGNRFGMLVLYGLINFLGLFAIWMQVKLYSPLIYGMLLKDRALFLSPVADMCRSDLYTAEYCEGFYRMGEIPPAELPKYVTLELTNYLPRMAIYAAIGCGCIALAMFLLRRRKPECAGDMLAFGKGKPVFLVLCSLCSGVAFHMAGYVFGRGRSYLMLFVGMVLGYYACLMLLKRQMNVFTKKSILSLAVIAGTLFLSLALTGLNVFGITYRIPEVSTVKELDITLGGVRFHAETPEEIESLQSIQQLLLDEHHAKESRRPVLDRIFGYEDTIEECMREDGEHYEYTGTLMMFYNMKDGSVIDRCYQIHESGPYIQQLRDIYSRPEIVFTDPLHSLEAGSNLEALAQSLQIMQVSCGHNATEIEPGTMTSIREESELQELFQAILADCEDRNMGQSYVLHAEESSYDSLQFYFQIPNQTYYGYCYLNLFPCCENTMTWLESHGYHTAGNAQ